MIVVETPAPTPTVLARFAQDLAEQRQSLTEPMPDTATAASVATTTAEVIAKTSQRLVAEAAYAQVQSIAVLAKGNVPDQTGGASGDAAGPVEASPAAQPTRP